MGRKRARQRKHVYFFVAALICLLLMEGCALMQQRSDDHQDRQQARHQAGESLTPGGLTQQGERLLAAGDYHGALKVYRKALEKGRSAGTPAGKWETEQALFHIGVIYASPKNAERDYPKAIDTFQRLAREFPQSRYRGEAERSIALLREVVNRDKRLRSLRRQVDSLETQIEKMKAIDLDIEEKRKHILNAAPPGPAK